MLPAARADQSQKLLVVCAICVAALVPFLNKAVHIDETLFLWAAQWITAHPLNFYGGSGNWNGTLAPMPEIMKNPPLTSYYLAAVGSVMGWREVILHAAFIPFAVLTVAGTFLLARRLGASPMIAALALLASPAFFVSATTFMSDVMMLAAWTWAVLVWIWGLDRRSNWLLVLAGVIIVIAVMTKYPAMSLVPLLAAYGCMRRRCALGQLVALGIVIVALAAYQLITARMYGRGLLTDASEFAAAHASPGAWTNTILTTSFTGGGLLAPALVMLARMRRMWIVVAIITLAIAISVAMRGYIGETPLRFTDGSIRLGWLIQFIVMIVCGTALVVTAVGEGWTMRRDADMLMLALWIAGVWVFTAYVNWTINARTVLPMAPAAAILAARGLDNITFVRGRIALAAPALALGGLLTILAGIGDYQEAGAARAAAQKFQQATHGITGQIWFTGHWGFQWYMEQFAKPFDSRTTRMLPDDFLAIDTKNSNAAGLPAAAVEHLGDIVVPVGGGVVSTLSYRAGADFYSHHFGAIPYAVGSAEPEVVKIYRVKAVISQPNAR